VDWLGWTDWAGSGCTAASASWEWAAKWADWAGPAAAGEIASNAATPGCDAPEAAEVGTFGLYGQPLKSGCGALGALG
jgi:hypothetical protein